jgi:hypothetical protein
MSIKQNLKKFQVMSKLKNLPNMFTYRLGVVRYACFHEASTLLIL